MKFALSTFLVTIIDTFSGCGHQTSTRHARDHRFDQGDIERGGGGGKGVQASRTAPPHAQEPT